MESFDTTEEESISKPGLKRKSVNQTSDQVKILETALHSEEVFTS